MGKKTEDYSARQVLPSYVRYGLRLRVEAGKALDNGEMQKFQKLLSSLHREYFEKFNDRSDIDRPEWAATEMLGIEQPTPVTELNQEQLKALYIQIVKLQDKLGHTKISTPEYRKRQLGVDKG